jgi:hypothetical protein
LVTFRAGGAVSPDYSEEGRVNRSIGVLALVAILAALPTTARAQRGYRNSGPAMTPYGPMYNPTQSPEWRQSGGNPYVYQQLMQQKAMMYQQKAMQQQYQAMQKQQQAFEKWMKEQKAKKDKGQPYDPQYDKIVDAMNKNAQAALNASQPRSRRSTKKHATPAASTQPVDTPSTDKDSTAKSPK